MRTASINFLLIWNLEEFFKIYYTVELNCILDLLMTMQPPNVMYMMYLEQLSDMCIYNSLYN